MVVVVCGLVLAAGAVAKPSRSAKQLKTLEYVTVYSGSFAMSNDWHNCAAGECSDWKMPDHYQWIIMRTDRFHDDGDNRFTETNIVQEKATGEAQDTGQSTPLNCPVIATGAAYKTVRSGRFVDTDNKDLKLPVYWSVPGYSDSAGKYFYFDSVGQTPSAPGIPTAGYLWAPGVTLRCTVHGNGHSFTYTYPDGTALTGGISGVGPAISTLYDKVTADQWKDHQVPSCGGQYLTPDPSFYQLWDGSTLIRQLSLPFERSFGFSKSIGGTAGPGNFFEQEGAGPATCKYSVSYDTNVLMYMATTKGKGIDPVEIDSHRAKHTSRESIPLPGSPSAQPPTPYTDRAIKVDVLDPGEDKNDSKLPYVNKVGELLLQDGLNILKGNAADLTSSDPTGTTMFPGMPEADTGSGTATLDVSGQVLPQSHALGRRLARTANTKQVALITGRASVPANRPSTIPITLTSAGKSVFTTGRTKPVTVRATLSFKPNGRNAQTISATKTLTIAAPAG